MTALMLASYMCNVDKYLLNEYMKDWNLLSDNAFSEIQAIVSEKRENGRGEICKVGRG